MSEGAAENPGRTQFESRASAKITHPIARFNQKLPNKFVDENGEVSYPNTDIKLNPTNKSGDSLPPPPDLAPSDEVLCELGNGIKLKDPKTGQEFNTIIANRKEGDENLGGEIVNVYLPLYGNEIETTESHERVVQLAHRLGDAPFLTLDHPGMGGSDSRSKEQSSTSKKDSYFEIADAELRVMRDLGINKINLIGQSMGSYAALALAVRAAEHGIVIENLVLTEVPGVAHIPLLRLAKLENDESEKLDHYHGHPYNKRMHEASGLDLPESERHKPVYEILRDMYKKDPKFVYARSMTKATVEGRLLEVLDSQKGIKQIVFINGGESKVSPTKKVQDIIRKVVVNNPEAESFLRQIIFPGEGHLAMAHAQRFANTVRTVIDTPPKNSSDLK